MNLSKYNEKLLKDFRDNFEELKDKRVVLYGLGEKTKILLNYQKEIKISGIWHLDYMNKIVYEEKVLETDEVIEPNTIIIIAATLAVVPVIYKKIEPFITNKNIDVYSLNGEKISQPQINWKENTVSKEYIINKMKTVDVISFDIFDTLVMRRCIEPERLLEEDKLSSFRDIRKNIEYYCYKNITKFFDIELIYETMRKQYQLSQYEIDRLKQTEIDLEFDLVIPRQEMVAMFNAAKAMNKTVVLTSDMYLGSTIISKILKKCGICGYDKLYISCECKAQKHDGSMFLYLKKEYPDQKILHIGDNNNSDVKMAVCYDMEAVKIPSSSELSKEIDFDVLNKAKKWDEVLTYGFYLSKAYNSPFSCNEYNGRIYINKMEDVGYLFFGPLVYEFCLWVRKKCMEEKIEQLLFLSRDGYIIKKAMDKLIGKDETPYQSIYFLTSRRASTVASIIDENDIEFIINIVCTINGISFEEMLNKAFGIAAKEDEKWKDVKLCDIDKQDLIEYLKIYYKDEILQNAARERKNYLSYISKRCSPNKKTAIINYVGRGVTQYSLEKIFKEKLRGYYFATEHGIEDIIEQRGCGCFSSGETAHTSKHKLMANYLLGEVIFSSPEGQLLYFDDSGEPCFQERKLSFKKGLECQKGIIKYIIDRNRISKRSLDCDNIDAKKACDKIFGELCSSRVVLSDEIKDAFIHTDYYAAIETYKLF